MSHNPRPPAPTHLFILRVCDILLHAKRPVDVQRVFVQGEHEDDEDEERVEHGEEEDHLVAQLSESGGDGVLLGLVGVERVEVLLDQVGPEGDLGPGEVVHLAARENGPVDMDNVRPHPVRDINDGVGPPVPLHAVN